MKDKLNTPRHAQDSQRILHDIPQSLLALENPPKQLFYRGDITLLDSPKIAIVGTRNPNPYTKTFTTMLAQRISQYAIVVSGGALGVDCAAHKGAFPQTIMISPSSLDIIYPKENKSIIQDITQNALIMSEYKSNYMPYKHSFLERNRLVIALSDIVILPQGDIKSGTSSSANIALKLQKPIFTLPHRYGESTLTNKLLAQGKVSAIYDIDAFIETHITKLAPQNQQHAKTQRSNSQESSDEILAFCESAPSFEEAYKKFGDKLLEYEFLGLLVRENNTIHTK